jgi:hypothetical protein
LTYSITPMFVCRIFGFFSEKFWVIFFTFFETVTSAGVVTPAGG